MHGQAMRAECCTQRTTNIVLDHQMLHFVDSGHPMRRHSAEFVAGGDDNDLAAGLDHRPLQQGFLAVETP